MQPVTNTGGATVDESRQSSPVRTYFDPSRITKPKPGKKTERNRHPTHSSFEAFHRYNKAILLKWSASIKNSEDRNDIIQITFERFFIRNGTQHDHEAGKILTGIYRNVRREYYRKKNSFETDEVKAEQTIRTATINRETLENHHRPEPTRLGEIISLSAFKFLIRLRDHGVAGVAKAENVSERTIYNRRWAILYGDLYYSNCYRHEEDFRTKRRAA